MPRTRDQFTGHVWVRSLTTDITPGTVPIYEIRAALENLGYLTAMNYLCLARQIFDVYELTVYPRRDRQPLPIGRVAARYVSYSLAVVFQAASNDYHHIFSRVAHMECQTTPITRIMDIRHEASDAARPPLDHPAAPPAESEEGGVR